MNCKPLCRGESNRHETADCPQCSSRKRFAQIRQNLPVFKCCLAPAICGDLSAFSGRFGSVDVDLPHKIVTTGPLPTPIPKRPEVLQSVHWMGLTGRKICRRHTSHGVVMAWSVCGTAQIRGTQTGRSLRLDGRIEVSGKKHARGVSRCLASGNCDLSTSGQDCP